MATAAARPGRSTLESGSVDEDEEEDQPPLFEEAAHWETIDPQESAEVEEAPAAAASGAAASTRDAEAGPSIEPSSEDESELVTLAAADPDVDRDAEPDEDEDVEDKDAEDKDADDDKDTDNAAAAPIATAAQNTAAPFRVPNRTRTTKRPVKRHFAKRGDAYNKKLSRKSMSKNQQLRKNQLDRAGVRINNIDSFKLKQSPAPRYQIINGNEAAPMDVVTKEQLAKKNRNGRKIDLAINPAKPRMLTLPGNIQKECVLVFVRGKGSGFMPIELIDAGGASVAKIRNTVTRASAKMPDKASAKSTTHFQFRDGGNAVAKPVDRERYILPDQKSGDANKVSDYLQHVGFSTGLGRKRDYYNISLSLPQPEVAPVAIDTALPNDHFFVPNSRKFYREVAIYQRGKATTKVRHVWAYGFVGGNQPKPDTKRRGWVPLRVLKTV